MKSCDLLGFSGTICLGFAQQAVTAGANPIAIKKGIDKTQDYLVGKLKENAKPVQGRNDIKVRKTRVCWQQPQSVLQD